MEILKEDAAASSKLVESTRSNAFDLTTPERFESDYGKRLMEKQGWRQGESLWLPSRLGLIEALDASDGKHPLDKRGIDYSGERVDVQQRIEQQKQRRIREKRQAPYYIASKYDSEPAQQETLYRRFEPNMKYRANNKSSK
jgi:hypothetical protein